MRQFRDIPSGVERDKLEIYIKQSSGHAEEEGNLIAATHAMAEMRCNIAELLSLLGEHGMNMQKVFDASPTIQRIKAETASDTSRKDILHWLEKRFGPVPEELAAHLRTVNDQNTLDRLLDAAFDCSSLETFRTAMIASP